MVWVGERGSDSRLKTKDGAKIPRRLRKGGARKMETLRCSLL